jgi:hypothetical protein
VSDWSAALRVTEIDEDGEFSLSEQQLASALDPHCTFRSLIERPNERQPDLAAPRHVGRPYHIWRDNLELARLLNDRLASGAPD